MSLRAALLVVAFAATQALAHGPQDRHGKPPPTLSPGVHSLDVYLDGGTLHVLIGMYRAGETRATLWHQSSSDSGATWSASARVDAGAKPPRHPRRGEDAQIAASGRNVVAVWSTDGTGWGGSGPLAAARSEDGGRTWAPASNPADSGLTTGHGFADLRYARGALQAVWLDSRDKAQGLWHARSADHGRTWAANVQVAARTCECCWNSLAESGSALLVLFRGKDPRDMLLASAGPDTGWTRKGRVGAFDWSFKGCPETGGALAPGGDGALHALVWTGAEKYAGLHYLVSRNQGGVWSAPRALGRKDTQHADLAAADAVLAAVWDEHSAKGSIIRAAFSRNGGARWTIPIRVSGEDAEATHPRVVAVERGFLAFWTERHKSGEWALGRRLLEAVRRPGQ